MKAFLIVLGIVTVIFISVQVYFAYAQKGIERYSYSVEKKYPNFEIRVYEPTLFSSVKLSDNTYKDASSKGFSILAGYIFGGNDKQEKIAMTSPVSISLEDSMTMMFMVPKEYKQDNLPTPNQSQIQFVEIPEKRMAAIHFGGWANDEKIEKYKQKLITLLEENGLKYTNKYYFFGYNAPFEVVNRRNEILVELPTN
ncbi:MAG: SOUL family heme-binding protein [Lishizhenia sp.]